MNVTLGNVITQPDWAVRYRWNLDFDRYPEAVGSPAGIDILNQRCESSELPKSTGKTFSVTIRGLEDNANPGGWSTAGKIRLTFVETVDGAILDWIETWREKIWLTGIGSGSPKSQLLAAVSLYRLDRNDSPNRLYRMPVVLLGNYDNGGDLDEKQDGGPAKPWIELVYPSFLEFNQFSGVF